MKPRTVTVTLEIVTDAPAKVLTDKKLWMRVGFEAPSYSWRCEQVQVNVAKATKAKGCA